MGGMREIVPHTRRERVANYGDSVAVVGTGRSTLFDHTGETGSSILLTVECTKFFVPPGAPVGDFRPYVHVEWGHGGSNAETNLDATYRQRFPVCASMFKVQAYIASLPLPATPNTPGVPVPSGTLAKFRAFVCEGTDALPLFATRWVSQLGLSSGLVTPKQARLARARVVAIPAAGSYFQVFDLATTPPHGSVPVDVVAVDVAGNALLDVGQTRAFVRGLSWGMSSTLATFTATGVDVAVFFELET